MSGPGRVSSGGRVIMQMKTSRRWWLKLRRTNLVNFQCQHDSRYRQPQGIVPMSKCVTNAMVKLEWMGEGKVDGILVITNPMMIMMMVMMMMMMVVVDHHTPQAPPPSQKNPIIESSSFYPPWHPLQWCYSAHHFDQFAYLPLSSALAS